MILVCMGCTLIMVVGEQIPPSMMASSKNGLLRVDPGRLAQGIVTGIGFLGAGVIVKLRDVIRGVTTAATIWFVAAIGICLGYRDYSLAVATTVAALVILFLFQYPERLLKSHIYRAVKITMDAPKANDAMVAIRKALSSKYSVRVLDVDASLDVSTAVTKVTLQIRTHQAFQAPEVVQALATIGGVRTVEWD